MTDMCKHVPPSPAQSMCQCESLRIEMEELIDLQARHITRLEKRLWITKPVLLHPERDVAHYVKPTP